MMVFTISDRLLEMLFGMFCGPAGNCKMVNNYFHTFPTSSSVFSDARFYVVLYRDMRRVTHLERGY